MSCPPSRAGLPGPFGEVAEWPNAPVLKTGVADNVTGGSNPPLSACCLDRAFHIVIALGLELPA